MRVPLSWLREHCDPGLSAEEIAERLDMTGTEVLRVDRVGVPDSAGFVVGRVVTAERHPDADRLSVLEVDAGDGTRTIVCGAPNVAADQTVAVALPGALLADGTELREAELRGVRSSGMVLAEDELGLGDDHEGILVLEDDAEPGTPLERVLPIAEEVLELEITPNRPDCLGVYGVAREVHAATGAPLGPDPCEPDASPAGEDDLSAYASLDVDPEICLRFTARAFDGVAVGPSPAWLRARLWAAGQRPISNVVDITNYVMLLSGQPLHAFDLDRVAGGAIVVRRAAAGERMTTLDGVERQLDESMALVCDPERPSGIAGIMGGQVSEVSGATTRVLMEVATWVGPNILQTSKRLALRSEASTRFEKQLHPDQAIAAQRLASRLMVELTGARLVPGTLDAYPHPAPVRSLMLRPARLRSLLGAEIGAHQAAEALERLDFEVAEAEESLRVAVPGFRDADVQREADLIEEVARVHGLSAIPATLPGRSAAVGRLSPHQRMRRRVEDALRDAGAHEIVAWSFTSAEKLTALRLDPADALVLANPLSEEHALMRPLLLPGLLDAARRNAAHGRPALALFESAHAYGRAPGAAAAPEGSPRGAVPAAEGHRIGGLLTRAVPGGWRAGERPADFFAAKALVAAALDALRVEWAVEPMDDLPFLHPARAGRVLAGGTDAGWIGELHPLVLEEWDLPAAAAFELSADALAAALPRGAGYRPVSPYPPVFQDLAIVAPAELPAARIEGAIRAGAGELLGELALFDLYTGEQLGEGERSLAYRLEFRAADRTLTDDEVGALRAAIVAELERLGGRLR